MSQTARAGQRPGALARGQLCPATRRHSTSPPRRGPVVLTAATGQAGCHQVSGADSLAEEGVQHQNVSDWEVFLEKAQCSSVQPAHESSGEQAAASRLCAPTAPPRAALPGLTSATLSAATQRG